MRQSANDDEATLAVLLGVPVERLAVRTDSLSQVNVRAIDAGQEYPDPVKPNTIAKSIAIGNPADGFQVVRAVRATGGARGPGQ